MKYPGLASVTFQQIEIFLAAARYENFSLTAQELFLTQATVSRNIQNLEQTLGLVLFIRHKKRVMLTNAGRSLAKDLQQVLSRTDKALDHAFQQQQNQFRQLSIGDQNSSQMEGYLLPIVKDFEKNWPSIELAIQMEPIPGLVEGLRSGKYDAVFATSLSLDSLPVDHIAYEKIIDLEPCIVVAKGHPLYDQEDITLEELSTYTLLSMREGLYENYARFVQNVCAETGLNPSRVKFVANEFTIAMELKRGNPIVIMDRHFAPISPTELRYIPLPPCETHSGVAVIWSKDCQNPNLNIFLESVKATATKLDTHCV